MSLGRSVSLSFQDVDLNKSEASPTAEAQQSAIDNVEVTVDPSPNPSQQFSSGIHFFLSALGCAIGTGNIWRFSRIVALNGGENGAGSFLMVWLAFLFLWSIPIIIGEYAMGRKSHLGLVGTFDYFLGPRWRWLGLFVTLVNSGIGAYYSVVSGWCLYYTFQSAFFDLPTSKESALDTWNFFQQSGWPVLTHFISLAFAAIASIKGVKTIEKVNMFLVPCLLVILIVAFLRAVTLPNASAGVAQLFYPDFSALANPNAWLEALTQNAWDTSAGWGLFLTYANYLSINQGVSRIGMLTPVINNGVSLLCATTTFATTFGMLSYDYTPDKILAIMRESGPAGTGLTFIWFPQLFDRMFGGRVLAVCFFLALSFGALSSLISNIALPIKIFVDAGVRQWVAVTIIASAAFLLGLASALSNEFLANQDYVWGGALLLSGAAEAFLMIRYGVRRFREEIINTNPDDKVMRWWDFIVFFIIPVEVAALLVFWFISSLIDGIAATDFSNKWYNPIGSTTLMTCLIQWVLAVLIGVVYNIIYLKRKKNLKPAKSSYGNVEDTI